MYVKHDNALNANQPQLTFASEAISTGLPAFKHFNMELLQTENAPRTARTARKGPNAAMGAITYLG
jgi:hypothetical protein